jgi:hypothetical protein
MVSMNAAMAVPELRQALRDEVAATSLHNVSRQTGMTAGGLQRFIDGGRPYTATRRRLERWYVLHGPGRHEAGLSGGSALAILRVLVQDLAPARHRPTLELLVKSLEDAYATARLPQPGWLGEVRGEIGGAGAV